MPDIPRRSWTQWEYYRAVEGEHLKPVYRFLARENCASGHRSKHLEEFLDSKVHTVITVCGYADQVCPIFPGMVKRYHWGFDDPAKATGSEEEVFAVFAGCATK
jgi:protein-tyrosine-phosphatase